jgi:hypothetical protein
MEVPVLVVDLDDDEARKLLLTLDPLAAMAGRDEERLSELLATVSSDNDTINALLQALANGYEPLTILDLEPITAEAYTQVVDTPIYEPSGPPPEITELSDRSTADELLREIRDAELPAEVERFMLDAAERHVVFNFQRIANYYAHAPDDVQALMERSALVVIDYDQAIERGFVRLKEDIDAAFHEDHPDA